MVVTEERPEAKEFFGGDGQDWQARTRSKSFSIALDGVTGRMNGVASLTQNSFFSAFSPRAIQKLAGLAVMERYHEGQTIFQENDPSAEVWLVLEGTVHLTRNSPGSKPVEIGAIRAGDFFGELGVLDGGGRSTGASAGCEVELARIPRQPLLEVLDQEPVSSTLHLVERVFQYLRTTNDRYVAEMMRKGKMQFIGEMAGSIIHDFKNPITGIQLAAQMLQQGKQDEGTTKWCGRIIQQTQRMVAMAQELLDFSRGGQSQLNLESMPVSDLLEQFETLNAEFIRLSHCTLVVESCEAPVAVDPSRIMRVLQNLIGNAVDAMAPNGGTILVTTREENAETILLEIKDDGPGIPESIRENFFDPFVTFGKKQGTGLGSAIARNMVEAHGGTISFTTATGQGTTFHIRLPRAP